jgi:hypothetical protein
MINLIKIESDLRKLCSTSEYYLRVNADYYRTRPLLLRSRLAAIRSISRHTIMLHILDNKSACTKIMEVSNEIRLLLTLQGDFTKDLMRMYLKHAENIVLGHAAEAFHPHMTMTRPLHKLKKLNNWKAA